MPLAPKKKAFSKMSGEELRLAKMWHDEDGKSVGEIGQFLRRDRSTIDRRVIRRHAKKKQGRPSALSEAQKDSCPHVA